MLRIDEDLATTIDCGRERRNPPLSTYKVVGGLGIALRTSWRIERRVHEPPTGITSRRIWESLAGVPGCLGCNSPWTGQLSCRNSVRVLILCSPCPSDRALPNWLGLGKRGTRNPSLEYGGCCGASTCRGWVLGLNL
jgi:hypothetical protein